MSQILINDIFHELKEENNRLLNELLLAQKCVHLLEKYRNCLISFDKNCKCNQNINNNINNKLVFDLLEKDFNEYKSLRTIEDIIECNEKTFNCDLNEEKNRNKRKQILRPNNGFELITHQNNDLDINESNVCNNGSQIETIAEDEDYRRDGSHRRKYKRCDLKGCNFKTVKRRELVAHKNRHLGLKPYKCPIIGCDKTFSGHKNLYSHQKNFHTKEKKIICDFLNCGKKFKTLSSMKIHLKSHFHRERIFSCSFANCDYKAFTKTLLTIHIKSHSNERPFNCTIDGCDKSFKWEYNLKSHLNTHNKDIAFKCNFIGCDKSFRFKATLIRHVLMHKNELPLLSCDWPGCEFSTYRKYCLQKHRIGVHSSESNYVCDWPECGKRFKFKEKLKLHQRIHNNDKRYVCHWPGCQYRCVDNGNLKKHLKIHSKHFQMRENY